MAASKSSYFPRTSSNYRFLPTERNGSMGSDSLFELHESDVWNSASDRSASPDFQNSVGGSRWLSKKKTTPLALAAGKRSGTASSSSSLPVNVPDWSKILKHEYRENRRRESEDDYDEDEGDEESNWVPPHEFLARQVDRTRVAFSVHEGIGRTLKGRDLSRVRNAIFDKTGFQD